jgi:type IVB pilus formation R64 PilN family outer membrane protein
MATSNARSVCAVAALAVLAGCGQMQATQESVNAVHKEALTLRDENVASAAPASISRTQRPRLAGEEIVLRSATSLPPLFSKRVVYSTQGAQSLSEVLDAVATMAGVAINASEVAQKQGQAPASSGASATQDAGLNGKVTLEFSGTLKALLDELALRNDASWRFNNKTSTVEVFRYETRTLSVLLPPGSKNVAASISLAGVTGGGGDSGGGSGGSGGGSGSGAGNVSVSQSLTVNPWQSVMTGIQSILSEGEQAPTSGGGARSQSNSQSGGELSASGPGGRAAATPELGLITVTARPKAAARIASYVDSINARFAQNVMIDIKVYSLTLSSTASAGFSLDTMYSFLNKNGVSIVGPAPLNPENGTPGRLTLSMRDPNSRLYGSSLVAQALSQFGNVALQTQGQVLAVNGQPSPIQVANEVNYLASSQLTQSPNVGSTSTLTPGTRVVGFTANFLPLILGDNRILLQYQIQLSSLTALTQVSSGTSTIQTPQISSQSLQQQAFVKDGQSIVLFGFDQNRDTADTAMSLGGASKAARSERQMVVIVMQVNGGTKNG